MPAWHRRWGPLFPGSSQVTVAVAAGDENLINKFHTHFSLRIITTDLDNASQGKLAPALTGVGWFHFHKSLSNLP